MLGDQFSTPAVIADSVYVVPDNDSQEVALVLPDADDTTISSGEVSRLILTSILIFSIIAVIAHFVH